MKRSTLILLVFGMVSSFIGLVILQVRYVTTNAQMIGEQFSENVQYALSQTVSLIEENEALEFLSQALENEDYNPNKKILAFIYPENYVSLTNVDTNSIGVNPARPTIRLSTGHGKATIEETSRYLQELFQENFARRKTILDQAVFRWMRQSEGRTIEQRIDFEDVENILRTLFESKGITQPYYVYIAGNSGNMIYKSEDAQPLTYRQATQATYKQQFFPLENTKNPVFLKVVFPEKQNFILQSMNLLLPSVGLMLLILIIFVVAIIIILRQKQLEIMKTDFINNMTHEFKTPISSVSLAAQMLKDASVGKSPEMMKHIATVIGDETKRLGFQVDKVLQMAMFEKENSTLKLTELSINELIRDIVNTFSLKVQSKGGTIITKFEAKNDCALVDEVHFTNIIYNLMDNALKYSDKSLLLTVETWNEKDRLLIGIEDNGIGIRKEDQKRIFERFFRVSTGNTHNIKGFGLGLAYVKKMVLEHRGTIKVESEPGLGTKFIISIHAIGS
ncbi:MAG: HAMP domain-containing histidine kinase [Prevotellaceae bacterium]|jgi:two-component system phosphate regulon sensor histidine kinase PhoR|nr:HAMP domain-containing histidine kinase [Prevotellaceae bacterium]